MFNVVAQEGAMQKKSYEILKVINIWCSFIKIICCMEEM
jgi:hypothetical protein